MQNAGALVGVATGSRGLITAENVEQYGQIRRSLLTLGSES